MSLLDDIDSLIRADVAKSTAAMRDASAELNRRQSTIDQYRRDNAKHERLIGDLLERLNKDDLDGARDLVKAEYDAIHGPRD